MSHLLQMRGLKPKYNVVMVDEANVASFTDAWIETDLVNQIRKVLEVASFTDAWIETSRNFWFCCSSSSHLLQMRGLKLN